MDRRIAVACLLAGCVGAQGCGWARNVFAPPGTMAHQQSQASLHDPYAVPDTGPDVVGARPREFQKPAAEPVRSRYFVDGWPPGR